MIKPIAANNFKKSSGIIAVIDPPAIAPIKLARTRADDAPIKTASGLFDVPLIATVANWVLSPSSASNTVVKTEMNRGISISVERRVF